ncbi:hypothetical protein [Caballeronia insecticola]|uniref:Uncharacterized protein n=1 Tax=Caballeronia insecticola TaxID=758793 RepID=R4WQW7_9BURK|nr:hypothetical protein [Caballeronia insecticola]BAN27093.1 putative uncharacterized protein [Caballeronia insecticola]
MLTRTRTLSPDSAGSGYGATIVVVKAARDLVDAHRRLHGSVLRFLSRFDDAGRAVRERPQPLETLVGQLEKKARAAGFARMRELSATVQAAREAARQREWLFADSFGTDAPALQEAARALERLDATLVGLCVEHVLQTTAPRAAKSRARRTRQDN